MTDRILEIVDLLMGAAHADKELRSEEERVIRQLLARLLAADELPPEVDARVRGFEPTRFDLVGTAARFAADSDQDKRKLVELVAAVHDADEEIDLDEDTYLGELAGALGMPDVAVADLTLDYEVEDLREHLRKLRQPPPIPGR